MDFDQELRKVYYHKSGKYKGIYRLWNRVRGKIEGITKKDVEAFVQKQQGYQLTKQYKPPKEFTTVRAPKPGTNLQIDLMFFNPNENIGNVRYNGVMNVVDVHSRRAWSLPFKKKKALVIKKLFKQVIKEIEADKGVGVVKHLNQDDGKEFMGAFKQFVIEKGIKQHISARDDFAKNPIVERFNRTLRETIEKYEQDYPGRQILKRWQKVISSYNKTYHSTIKNKPMKVWNGGKNTQKYKDIEYNFEKGDKVRVLRKKDLVEKGKYAWKPGLYTIHKKKKRGYILKDKDGVRQARRYMGYELQRVDKDVQVSKQYTKKKAEKAAKVKKAAKAKKRQKRRLKKEGLDDSKKSDLKDTQLREVKDVVGEYVVDKVLDRRKRSNLWEYLVTWKGYDDQTWEPRRSFTGGAQRLYEAYDKANPIPKKKKS